MAKKQKCTVIRSFWLNGKMIEKGKTVELDEPFAIEMKASLAVEFVGSAKGAPDEVPPDVPEVDESEKSEEKKTK